MKIEKGTSRIAVVGEHITLKFPQIKLGRTVRAIQDAIKRGKLSEYVTRSEKHPDSLARDLFRGWFENLREWRLSQEITDTIVPTRFSIFGLMNIQDTAKDIKLPYPTIGIALLGKIPDHIIIDHGSHTIASSGNFGIHEGVLKIRDYGELGLDYLLINYGAEIKQAAAETMAKNQAR